MIKQLIEWSVANRFLVLALTTILIALGIYQTLRMPIDAIPDLSDVQVIIQTDFPGQTPKLVEDQVTYPLTTIMSSVPYAKTVRGYSYFGVSFVYIIFEDGTDMYWARSRVLEYLNSATANLPELAKSRIGPDATGVGWVLQYSLTDSLNRHNLQELRSIQDWFLKFELQTVRGVSEIASIGGFVKQYQVDIDPLKLRTLNLSLADVIRQVKQSNQAIGARLIEQAESEFMVSAPAYISSIPDLEKIVIRSGDNGSQVVLADIATIHLGPELRRGVLEINGEGESVGGIAVMRYGENALRVIADLKTKMASLKSGLPEGVGIHIDYDRSLLINRAVSNVTWKLLEEMLLVAVITILFLLHFRSAMIAIISIPVGILISLICMNLLGLNANVMSLAGIGIAIGVMVDASIVMIENAHKRLAKLGDFTEQQRREIILLAAKEVGPALFFSLLIITISFLPVFTLEQVEGRLFKPLAYTKTFAMAASSVLAITLIPVLMSLFVRGKFRQESDHRVMKRINDWYRFLLKRCLNYPKTIVSVALFSLLISLYPLAQLGSEFMPALEEGDLLYMPTTLPGISITKAKEILQETDRIIAAFPEVERVIGKVGRAETATDPAPLSMLETVIRLKDESQWRAGMTIKKLVDQLDQAIQIPGLTNAWTMPIRTRIDMLATGIKTPIGIKIAGTDLRKLEEIGQQIEQITRQNPNTLSVYAERSYGGNYLTINLDRGELARYGFTIADVQTVIASAIGGMNIAYSVEGLERYPIQLRYPREYRDQVDVLSDITIRSSQGFHVPLKQLASFAYNEGPAMIKSEHSRPNAWVYIDIRDIDVGSYISQLKPQIEAQLNLPPGYSISWSGQFEYMQRTAQRLRLIVPVTLAIILILLFVHLQKVTDSLLILLTVPFALIGSVWFLYINAYDLSVAVAVGLIALAGLATETGIVMLLYLKEAIQRFRDEQRLNSLSDLNAAVIEGAVDRLRPKLMTILTTLFGLLPMMFGSESGAAIMKRIAAPMIGGLITSTLMTLFLIPILYEMLIKRRLKLQ